MRTAPWLRCSLAPGRCLSRFVQSSPAVAAVVLVQLALLASLAAVFALAHGSHFGEPWLRGGALLLLGWSFVIGAVVALLRTTAWRLGMLMAAAGLAQIVSLLATAAHPLPFIVGAVLFSLPLVLIGHTVLAFPSGLLNERPARRAVALGWLAAFGMSMVWLPASPPEVVCSRLLAEPSSACPQNAVLIGGGSHAVANAAIAMAYLAGLVAVGLAIAVLLRRWRSGSEAWRHAVAPVLLTGTLMLAVLMLGLGAGLLQAPGHRWFQFAFSLVAALVPVAFVLGLIRARLERAAAVELMARLGVAATHEELRATLTSALGDPGADVLYAAGDGRYLDAAGRPRALPGSYDDRRGREIRSDGHSVGALLYSRALDSTPELIDAIAGAASPALVNQRLNAELRGRLEELRESRARIVQATDDARRTIERNLHDGTQQRLLSISMAMGLAESRFGSDPESARRLLSEARRSLAEALRELRELSQGVHPGVLAERGLGEAVKELAYSSPQPIEIAVDLDRDLPQPVEAGAYYVVAEGLANATKHARSQTISVDISTSGELARVRVADDGVGGADPDGGGLRGLSDRVEALGGRLRVVSPPAVGTVLEAELPCVS